MRKKIIGIFVIILFVGAGVVPSISGSTTKSTDVKSAPNIKKINPTATCYPRAIPDLIVYTMAGPYGNDIYESPPPSTQNYGYLFSQFSIFYLFVIQIQNDGTAGMNCSINSTLMSGKALSASRIYYPTSTGFVSQPLTSVQMLPYIPPDGSLMIFMFVIKFPWGSPVKVLLGANCYYYSTFDFVDLHT